MNFTFDPAVVSAILGLGGIGLVYVLNFLKKALGLEGKPAVLLVLGVSAAGTAIVLVLAHGFGLLAFALYTLAVFGEMTSWYKLTAPKTA
jgi:hypothetical protein